MNCDKCQESIFNPQLDALNICNSYWANIDDQSYHLCFKCYSEYIDELVEKKRKGLLPKTHALI